MEQDSIPTILAGPILRLVESGRIALWLALRSPFDVRLELAYDTPEFGQQQQVYQLKQESRELVVQSVSPNLHYHLIDIALEPKIPFDCIIEYSLCLRTASDGWQSITELAPHLCFSSNMALQFKLPKAVNSVLHGSCRNPHFDAPDGLLEAEKVVRTALVDNSVEYPAMLVLSGDQIYGDDVCGPMLHAIHQVIQLLKVPQEDFSFLNVPSLTRSSDILNSEHCYYQREEILPNTADRDESPTAFFSGARKPIFTSVNAQNHLMTLGEYLVMYLLVWAPGLWALVDLTPPERLNEEQRNQYLREKKILVGFIDGLSRVQSLLAHIPVAMIFDDHDLSDDWNLNRAWEEAVYGHGFSRRIIGNGLIAYLINQAWGNRPEQFEKLWPDVAQVLRAPGGEAHEALTSALIKFERWEFIWNTEPKLVVLDTRTRRWRSESSPNKPSGLLDWEALTDLQEQIKDLPAVILVSSAPIFGVKLIEVIQKVFTFLGYPLMVDAENWMAHPGSANGILNVFRHKKTPKYFTVLSGDVHYSFAYDIRWRRRKEGPEIWQICSSGLRNGFPPKLLAIFDQLNQILYSPRSPLNGFTRRRKLRITPRKPEGTPKGVRLLNRPGVGLVEFDANGRPRRISQLTVDGECVEFTPREKEARWD